MLAHKLLALHKHTARTTAGVEHTPTVRLQHGHQQFHNATRCVELATLLAFGQGELTKEIFEHMPQQVGTAVAGVLQRGVADKVYQFPQ